MLLFLQKRIHLLIVFLQFFGLLQLVLHLCLFFFIGSRQQVEATL